MDEIVLYKLISIMAEQRNQFQNFETNKNLTTVFEDPDEHNRTTGHENSFAVQNN